MNNPAFSSPLVQSLIRKAEVEKRSAFLAGAAWVLEELDKKYPEWSLQSVVPPLLTELAKAAPATTSDQAIPTSNIILPEGN